MTDTFSYRTLIITALALLSLAVAYTLQPKAIIQSNAREISSETPHSSTHAKSEVKQPKLGYSLE